MGKKEGAIRHDEIKELNTKAKKKFIDKMNARPFNISYKNYDTGK